MNNIIVHGETHDYETRAQLHVAEEDTRDNEHIRMCEEKVLDIMN